MPTQVIAPPESEPQESQVSIILEILADGSAKDVVSVSNELEKKGNFADINQVRSVCEKLIQQGRLERVGEGEFFAQYRLRTVASAQSTSPWLRPPSSVPSDSEVLEESPNTGQIRGGHR